MVGACTYHRHQWTQTFWFTGPPPQPPALSKRPLLCVIYLIGVVCRLQFRSRQTSAFCSVNYHRQSCCSNCLRISFFECTAHVRMLETTHRQCSITTLWFVSFEAHMRSQHWHCWSYASRISPWKEGSQAGTLFVDEIWLSQTVADYPQVFRQLVLCVVGLQNDRHLGPTTGTVDDNDGGRRECMSCNVM